MTPDSPANLVALWIWVETRVPGRHLADAVRELAEEIGRPIRQSRIYEWRDGKRTPPADVQFYMFPRVIDHALELALGIPRGTYTRRELKRLVRMLCAGWQRRADAPAGAAAPEHPIGQK